MRPADEVLRDVFAERADGITPSVDVYGVFLARRRRNRRRALVGAGVAAAIVVGAAAAVPAVHKADRSLPALSPTGPAPTPTDDSLTACVPPILSGDPTPPPPVPVSQLPRQHDVRGSLAGDRAVTDAALVAGWQGIGLNERGLAASGGQRHTMDRSSLRLRFVERAGAGTLALVTAADKTGRWQVASWVVGLGTTFRPTGGPSERVSSSDRTGAERFYGDDPVYVSAYPVCGRIFGVVLAPPEATATLLAAPHIGPDGKLVTVAAHALPLTDGLAVFPTDGGASKVSITRGATVLGTGSLNQFDGLAKPGPDPLTALVDKAVKDAPPGTDADMVRFVVQSARFDLRDVTGDPITGVRVLWAGRTNKGLPAVVVAMTLPSGAAYVSDRTAHSDGTSGGSGGGMVPAGQLDRTLYALGNRSGFIVVVPKGATRAEVQLTGGGVQQVALRYGGAFVAPVGRATPMNVRAFDKDGNLLAEQVPNEGLVHP